MRITPTHSLTAMALLLLSRLAIASDIPSGTQFVVQADQVVISPHSIGSTFEQANKAFTYDWTQYTSIAANQKKVPEVEALLNKHSNLNSLPPAEQQQVAELSFKLGAYYISTGRTDLAVPELEIADKLFTQPADKAKTYNQLALAYERNFATSKDPADFAKAITLTNKVLHDIYPGVKNADTAFAYSIQGLVQNNAGQMAAAEHSFKQAVMIYASLPSNMNELIARAKNKYAAILLTRTDKEKEAEAILHLEQAKAFWMAQENFYQTPYAARNFLTLGKAYLKTGNAQGACNEANRALPIYKSIYGMNNVMLEQPYRILTVCYAKIGDTKMSETYKAKLAELKKST